MKKPGKDAWTALRESLFAELGLVKSALVLLTPDSSLTSDFVALNKEGRMGGMEAAQYLLDKGCSPVARTRDGLTPAGVVALDISESRSKRLSQQDDDVRELLSSAEEECVTD